MELKLYQSVPPSENKWRAYGAWLAYRMAAKEIEKLLRRPSTGTKSEEKE